MICADSRAHPHPFVPSAQGPPHSLTARPAASAPTPPPEVRNSDREHILAQVGGWLSGQIEADLGAGGTRSSMACLRVVLPIAGLASLCGETSSLTVACGGHVIRLVPRRTWPESSGQAGTRDNVVYLTSVISGRAALTPCIRPFTLLPIRRGQHLHGLQRRLLLRLRRCAAPE